MLYTKEFNKLLENFEKYASENLSLGSMGLTMETKENWIRKAYYCDGIANESFKMFMVGYMLGKIS